ncbi:MAG TPA: hypothetical protein VGQ97_03235 [Xanthobacteraceae bacterium]|nr:hypothetical protein [Xanthobacteraceae bacterium]
MSRTHHQPDAISPSHWQSRKNDSAPLWRSAGAHAILPASTRRCFSRLPPDGAKLAREGEDSIVVKTSGGLGPFTLLVDGLSAGSGVRMIPWRPAGPGFARLTVIDAKGAADSVFVRLQ